MPAVDWNGTDASIPRDNFRLLTQAIFLATLPSIYRFLRNDYAFATPGSLWIDAGLALQFVLPHSILLYPRTRAWITRRLQSEVSAPYSVWQRAASVDPPCLSRSPVVVSAWPESLRQ